MYKGTMIDDLIKAVQHAEQTAKTKNTNTKPAQRMSVFFLSKMHSGTQVQLGA